MRVALLLSLTYLVLAAALIGLAGCKHKYPAQECFSIRDCPDSLVCFYGTCQDPGYSIQTLEAELTPPSTSSYLPQQTSAPLDLSTGSQVISLAPTLNVTGTVADPDGAAVGPGNLIANEQGTIPGHAINRNGYVGADGAYQLLLVPGGYDLRVAPSPPTSGDAAAPSTASSARPPVSFGTYNITDDRWLDLPYPAAIDLVVVSGRVLMSSDINSAVPQALVSATAQTADGQTLNSSNDVTDPAGNYTLVFPPGAKTFAVRVQPYTNALVPDATVPVQPLESDPTHFADIVLGVATVTLDVAVKDGDGMPVAQAQVFFSGTNVGDVHGTFTSQVESDDSGAIPSTTLFPGDYVITVVPGATDPHAVSSSNLTLEPSSPPVALTVGNKVHLSGRVYSHAGAPVSGARVSLTLRKMPRPRDYSVQTDTNGAYDLYVDPGEYEIVVEPSVGSPLPRYRVLKSLQGDTIFDIHLYRATLVYGRVLGASGELVEGVSLSFYSAELSTEPTPLLVGLGVTGSRGEFVVPLPAADDN